MPRGVKRAAAKAAEEPGAKKMAALLKETCIDRSVVKAVAEVLEHPLADLSQNCQKMLQASLPWSLCPASDGRHEVQAAVVKMVGEVVTSVESKLQQAITVEAAKVEEIESRQAELSEGVSAAEKVEIEAMTAVEEQEAHLKELLAELDEKKKVLLQKQDEEQKGNAEISKLRADKEQLETVLRESFDKLKSGDFDDAMAESMSRVVQAMAKKLGVDESLLSALPSALVKRERMTFDLTVVSNFEETARSKISFYETAMEDIGGPAAERTAATADAQQQVDAAQASHQEALEKLTEARATSATASAELKKRRGELKGLAPKAAKAVFDRQTKEAELEGFRSFNLAAFETLRDRVSPQPTEKEAEADVAAE